MKITKAVTICILAVVVFLGTYKLATSEGVVPWFRISDVPYLQGSPEIAYNSTTNQYLVVWEDWRGAGAGTDVYAQLINSDSSWDGGNFSITVVDDWQRSPKPAYSPLTNKYLVVWVEQANDAHDIYGRMINANGTLSGAQFPIAAAAEYQWNPDPAYNSATNQFLVVFQDDRSTPGDEDIMGQLVNADGTLFGVNFTISSTGADQLLPVTACNTTNNQFLVVWDEDEIVYARMVNGNGSLDGAAFPISTSGGNLTFPDIAYASSANRFLVVWEQGADIYGRLVNADKTFTGPEFKIASSSGILSDPAVSYNAHSDQFMVVWSDSLGSDDIAAQLVGVDGSMPEPVIDLASQGQGDLSQPAVTSNTANNTFMAAWRHQTCHNTFDDCEDDDVDIFGAFYQASAHYGIYLPVVLRNFKPPVLPTPTMTHTPGSSPTPTPTSTPTATPTNTPTPTPSNTPGTWNIIMTENFEGINLGSGWNTFEGGAGDYTWLPVYCRAGEGSKSGWAVGGGVDGRNLGCYANYPSNANSWMTYGPFSLADATAADVQFKAWVNTEVDYDFLCWMASVDGTNYAGDCLSGDSSGWFDQVLDLSNVTDLGNVCGEPNVWVGFIFSSDGALQYPEGAYVDDIVLRKCTAATCPTLFMSSFTPDTPGLISFPAEKSLERFINNKSQTKEFDK